MNRADCLVGHSARSLVGEARDTEVGNFDCAVLQQHNILRLDVAVDNSALMSVLERLKNLGCEVDNILPLDNTLAFDILLKSDTVDVLHYDILNHITEAYVVHLYDVGVRKHGDSL